MQKKINPVFTASLFLAVSLAAFYPMAKAQEAASAEPTGMSLWQVLQSGGLVMIVLGLVSFLMMALVVFMFLRFRPEKFVPMESSHRIIELIRQKRFDEAEKICAAEESAVSSIAAAGLKAKGNLTLARESVEMTARKEVSALWTLLNYLSEIAQIAPMLGLLGTVLGMIQAFNTIAFDSGVVKPLMLAGGVAKAMITTAGGLSIAITAMIFYSILRPRAQNITNTLETVSSQIAEGFSK